MDLDRSLEIADKIFSCSTRIGEDREALERLNKEAEHLLPWGDFNPDDIRELQEKNVNIRLYTMTAKQYKTFPDDLFHFVLNRSKSLVRVAVVTLSQQSIDGFDESPLPVRGLAEVHKAREEREQHLRDTLEELDQLSQRRADIVSGMEILEQKIEFEQARISMGIEERLAYLSGYIPAKKIGILQKKASEEGWGLLMEEPGDEDPVPTLVRNPRFIRIIQPVFDLLGTVPGYRELDISFWFLLFFSLFFGMLIGDAGYGFIFLGLSIFIGVKSRGNPTGLLLMVLSIAAIAWGVLSGTWFGVEALSKNPLLSRLIIPSIASFGVDNVSRIMLLCFIIGAVHLSVAHLTNFIRYLPRMVAFAQLGWLSVLWGMYFVVRFIVLALPFNQIGLYLVAAGLGLVVLFGEQKGKFFKGLLLGLANLPLKLLDSISAFSDIISYVRLFAVGLATVEVAKSFNAMAADIGFGFPAALISAFILLAGHTLNIMMAALSVIVHGVRLNMLEFSGHLGMEWTGIEYHPFRERELPHED